MTAIGNQPTWVLLQGRPEQQGCSSRYSSGHEGWCLTTPGGLNVRLGRDSLGTPHLHGTFTGPGEFVACQSEGAGSVPLLLDTGAAIYIAGSLWRTRLKILPGVGISIRAVGGGLFACPAQGTFFIDFAEATGALPLDLTLFGTGAARFSVADVTSVCVAPVEWSPEPDPGSAPVQVNLVTGAGRAPSSGARHESTAKGRRKSRFSPPTAATRSAPSAWASLTAASSPVPQPFWRVSAASSYPPAMSPWTSPCTSPP